MSNTDQQSRRKFLQQTVLIGLAGLLPAVTRAQIRKVVVIGAGLSGLRSALLLEQAGFEVVVLEGRNRVGGRIRTLDDVPGRPEGGGNTIGPNYGRIISTAHELGVPLSSPLRGGGMDFLIDDNYVSRENWPNSDLNHFPDAFRQATPDRLSSALLRDNPLKYSSHWLSKEMQEFDIPAEQFFQSKGIDEQTLQLLAINNSYGNNLSETSLLNLYRVSSSIGRAISMRRGALEVSGGNSRLPEAMAASLTEPVSLNETVNGIHQQGSDLRIECNSGRIVHCDAVVCALPATAVRKISFSPRLPGKRLDAFQAVRYQKVTQAHLLASQPWWATQKESAAVASTQPLRTASLWTNGSLGRIFTAVTPNEEASYNITAWITGDACDQWDQMDEDAAHAAILAEFHRTSPRSRGYVEVAKLVRWAKDPFNRGAWAVWRPGEISWVPELLSRPHDRVFFAGEHTGISYSGMEGAMESADRAVLEVLRRLA